MNELLSLAAPAHCSGVIYLIGSESLIWSSSCFLGNSISRDRLSSSMNSHIPIMLVERYILLALELRSHLIVNIDFIPQSNKLWIALLGIINLMNDLMKVVVLRVCPDLPRFLFYPKVLLHNLYFLHENHPLLLYRLFPVFNKTIFLLKGLLKLVQDSIPDDLLLLIWLTSSSS